MSPRITLFLKSAAVLLLIIGHAAYKELIHVPSLRNIGTIAVTIFLIVSGVGLYSKYSDGITKGFLVKRFKKIYTSYLLFAPVSIGIYLYANRTVHLRPIFLYLLGVDYTRSIDPTMWYISFIVMVYILFFFIFSLKISEKYKILLFFALAVIFIGLNLNTAFPEIVWQFRLHALDFPVGLALASTLKHKDKLLKYLPASYPILLITGIYGFQCDTLSKQIVFGLSFGIIAFALAINLESEQNKKWLEKINYLGKISYEIYLVEWIILSIILKKFNFGNLNFLGFITITLMSAWALSLASKKLTGLLEIVAQIVVKKMSMSAEESRTAAS